MAKIEMTLLAMLTLAMACVTTAISTRAAPQPLTIAASLETDESFLPGDTLDDSCIWINKQTPSESRIIGTDKTKGLIVYDLNGKIKQVLPDGEMNNVDLREGFPLGGKRVALVAAGNRTTDTMDFYKLNPETKNLEPIEGSKLPAGLEIYGSCLYHSAKTQDFYFFANSKTGEVIQWQLKDDGFGKIAAQKVRTLKLLSQVEGCVADDELGFFYIGEEDVGIWKFSADPNNTDAPLLIDNTGENGNLVADVEGLTIYTAKDGKGYLLASSQGENAFNVYERGGSNRFVMKFKVKDPNGATIVQDTDGIDVTNANVGGPFPNGFFIVQDGYNGGRTQNFKLVPWEHIALANNPALLIESIDAK